MNRAEGIDIPNRFDAKTRTAFIARQHWVTGNISVHDLGWHNDQLWAVNTLFSCLCTFDGQHNFVPQWKPSFISELIPQDRCHLNGMAMGANGPAYVTCLGKSDTAGGWRDNKVSGGMLIDVASGEPILEGLCMPHSPRLHDSKLWYLNSGKGELNVVDIETGATEVIDRVPGYTRGLALAGQFAFVGMSQIRETNIFGGLPIGEQANELRCGVAVVDLISGRTVAWFEFRNGVEEVFAVEVIPGAYPAVLHSPNLDGDDQELWVIPPLQRSR